MESFGDPIYLNLPPIEDVERFLSRACDKARVENNGWKLSDVEYIRKMAGRHPELLRIACSSMFEYAITRGQMFSGKQSIGDDLYLDYSIDNAAGPICMQLWLGLARPELRGEPRSSDKQQEASLSISLHQRALLDIAKGPTGTKETFILPELEIYKKQQNCSNSNDVISSNMKASGVYSLKQCEGLF